ncbi:hypothetical protein EZ106_24930 [Escherichia coli]|nr:hypothetical protein [Escherichia coli]ENE03414.1 hypothetical protein ECP03019043_5089 [Escherichia coli P0301904.3]EEX8200767.1 hypothetical protein [Escherichia coli]EEX8214306.1 hypothetical protein [Escherichia coli]EEX9601220.1 hypothetical protein [Escherichia coli]
MYDAVLTWIFRVLILLSLLSGFQPPSSVEFREPPQATARQGWRDRSGRCKPGAEHLSLNFLPLIIINKSTTWS